MTQFTHFIWKVFALKILLTGKFLLFLTLMSGSLSKLPCLKTYFLLEIRLWWVVSSASSLEEQGAQFRYLFGGNVLLLWCLSKYLLLFWRDCGASAVHVFLKYLNVQYWILNILIFKCSLNVCLLEDCGSSSTIARCCSVKCSLFAIFLSHPIGITFLTGVNICPTLLESPSSQGWIFVPPYWNHLPYRGQYIGITLLRGVNILESPSWQGWIFVPPYWNYLPQRGE